MKLTNQPLAYDLQAIQSDIESMLFDVGNFESVLAYLSEDLSKMELDPEAAQAYDRGKIEAMLFDVQKRVTAFSAKFRSLTADVGVVFGKAGCPRG